MDSVGEVGVSRPASTRVRDPVQRVGVGAALLAWREEKKTMPERKHSWRGLAGRWLWALILPAPGLLRLALIGTANSLSPFMLEPTHL